MRKKHPVTVWLEYGVARALLALVRCLPPSWKEPACTIAAGIGFVLLPVRRRRTIDHVLYTGIAESRRAARRLALRSFRHLAMTGFEVFKLDQFLARRSLRESVMVEWDERWEKLARSKDGFIVLSAHYGNWEVGTTVAVELFGKPLHILTRPFANPRIERMLRDMRGRENVTVHSKIGGTKHLLRALRRGHGAALLVDQRAHQYEGGVTVTFLGRETRSHSVPAQLHLKTGIPIFVAMLRRLPGPFRFEFVLRGPFEIEQSGDADRDVEVLVRLYTAEMERVIREDPAQWLWAHRVWDGVARERRRGRGRRSAPAPYPASSSPRAPSS